MPLAKTHSLIKGEREAGARGFTIDADTLPSSVIAGARQIFEIPDQNDLDQPITVSGMRLSGDFHLIVDDLFAPMLPSVKRYDAEGVPDMCFQLPKIYTPGELTVTNPGENDFQTTLQLRDFSYALSYCSEPTLYHNLNSVISKNSQLALLPIEVLQGVRAEGPVTVIIASIDGPDPAGRFNNCLVMRMEWDEERETIKVSDAIEPFTSYKRNFWIHHEKGIRDSISRSSAVFFVGI